MKTKTQVFILAATSAASIGVGALLTDAGRSPITAASAEQRSHVDVKADAEAQACIEALVNRQLCPLVDTELGLSGNDLCNAGSDKWVVSAFADEVEGVRVVQVNATVKKSGSWTPGPPQ